MSLITRGAPTEIQALKAKIYSMEKREQKLQQRIAALEAENAILRGELDPLGEELVNKRLALLPGGE